MEARARRALAAVGFAAVVVAAIGVIYLRPWVAFAPAPRPSPQPALVRHGAPVLREQFLSASLGWVATGGAGATSLFRTTDGGRHWQHQLDGVDGESWTLSFFDASRGVVAGADARGPATWRTADGGQHWARHDAPCRPPAALFAFADPDHGWCVALGVATGRGGTYPNVEHQDLALYRTADSGLHWSSVLATDPTRPVSGGLGADGQKTWMWFRDARTGWIGEASRGSSAAVYTTTDGGDSWERRELPPPEGGWPANLGLVEYLEGSRSAPWVTVATYEAGAAPQQSVLGARYLYALLSPTWMAPALVQTSGALFVDEARWLVANGSSVLESTDAGENWLALGAVPTGWLVGSLTMVDRDHGWAVLFRQQTVALGSAVSGGLARTADGGRTWTLVVLPS